MKRQSQSFKEFIWRRIMRAVAGGNSGQGSTARSVVWNYAGHVYQLAINFGSTAYIARKVSVPEYGLLMFVVSLSITMNMLDLGIGNVLVQAYVSAKVEGGITRLNELLSTTFTVLTALGALGAGIFVVISALLPGPFNIPHQLLQEASTIFILSAFMIQAGLSVVAIEQVYQASQRYDRLNQAQLITATVFLILTVFVLAVGYGVVALASVQLIVALLRPVLLIAGLSFTIPGVRLRLFRVHLDLLRPLLSVSKWAFANSVCAYLLELVMWTILGTFGSMQAVAMFALANKLPKQLWNAIDRGASVFLPMMSTSAAERDDDGLKQTYILVQRLVVGGILPFVLLGSVFAWPLLDLWAGDKYRGATVIMQWLLLAAVGHAVAYPSWELVYACALHKKVVALSIWLLVASSASALLIVPRYGAAGLAIAIAIPNLLINVGWMTLIACKRLELPKRVLFKQMLTGLERPLLVLGLGVMLLLFLQPFLSTRWQFVGAVVCGCLYLLVWGRSTVLPLYRNRAEAIVGD